MIKFINKNIGIVAEINVSNLGIARDILKGTYEYSCDPIIKNWVIVKPEHKF